MAALAATNVKLAIASDFLTAFSRIPRGQQNKVLDFVTRFRADPTSSSINYEKIRQARDPNLRSVRIDQTYRGIVLQPEKGNVYVLLWVDHHDRAYDWARRKVCRIHPETGSIQLFDIEETEVAAPAAKASGEKAAGLFDAVDDAHLLSLGVPPMLLPLVRGLKTESDLEAAESALPQEAFEALYMLACGYALDEVLQETGKAAAKAEPVDTEDFAAALEKPDSKRRFWVAANEKELEAMLHAPLEKWRVFLHPAQRRLVERDWNGPVRVLGGAGTGKTVVAMHRAKWLAAHAFTGDHDRILFTTFTRNLAQDIGANLSTICDQDVMRRIEVVNLDSWVSTFLRRNEYPHQIDYGRRTEELWQRALAGVPREPALPATFYREEWERVLQPQGVGTLAEYLQASRVGRGVRLSRKARSTIWPVFEEYRNLLNEKGLRESEDAMRDAATLLEEKPGILPYRAVVVDEAQDMGAQAFRLIRRIVDEGPNDLFIVGDAHQRIYRRRVILGRCGIDIRGRSRKLRINYRTTEETRRWAVRLLEGVPIDDLDGGSDDPRGYRSLLHGEEPAIRGFDTFEDEVRFIGEHLERLQAEVAGDAVEEDVLRSTCLVARTNRLLDQYEAALAERGFETHRVRRSEPDDRRRRGLRLATMHRVKGLEFDNVIIAGLNDGIVPLEVESAGTDDPVIRRENEIRERALLHVSATRAKHSVLVTSFGRPSELIAPGSEASGTRRSES